MSKLRMTALPTLLLLCAWPVMGAAQQAALTDPAAIATCLCQERVIAEQQREIGVRQTIYERTKAEVDRLMAEVERRRPLVNVDLPAEVTAFRELLDELDAAQDRMIRSALPDYQAAVAAYNESTARYTLSCATGYHPAVLDAVKARLSCPAQ